MGSQSYSSQNIDQTKSSEKNSSKNKSTWYEKALMKKLPDPRTKEGKEKLNTHLSNANKKDSSAKKKEIKNYLGNSYLLKK